LYNGCRNQIKIPESMILEITEKEMLVNVDKHEIVINRDEYHDLKNQIKILKAKIRAKDIIIRSLQNTPCKCQIKDKDKDA